MSRVTENDVALAVLQIANANSNNICSLDDARAEVPKYLKLSRADLAASPTRSGEPLWHQQIRNIQSHHDADDNFISDGYLVHVPEVGYEATAKGIAHLKKLGL